MSGFAEWLEGTPVSQAIQASRWIIPLLQSIHILMIGIVFISSLMISLRVLGRMRADEPFTAVWSRFAPWMWSGLAVMAATGVLLVVGEPMREFATLSFWLKMALLAIGITITFFFGRSLRAAARDGRFEFSAGAKTIAIATVVLWLAIIFLGRAIAYDVEVWGTLSLQPDA